MINYILKLELNCKNKMIFAVQHREKDIALIMYEDCRRKGELMRDFSFYIHNIIHPKKNGTIIEI